MTGGDGRRIGFIVPSSNTVFEPELARLVSPLGRVTTHVSRVHVTAVAVDEGLSAQFGAGPMVEAGYLLADARADVIVWAGTSGMWLGIDQERRMLESVSSATGAPAAGMSRPALHRMPLTRKRR